MVDKAGKLLGRIMVDDVVDVIEQEGSEDIMKMAGIPEEDLVYGSSIVAISRARLPWLLTNLFGGLFTGYLMWLFRIALHEVIALITFIPVITAMGGNIGIQSSSIMIRGFATGRVDFNNLSRVLFERNKDWLSHGDSLWGSCWLCCCAVAQGSVPGTYCRPRYDNRYNNGCLHGYPYSGLL